MNMTSKELVYEALAFRDVPRVPYLVDFTTHAEDVLKSSHEGLELFEQLDDDIAFARVIRMEYGKVGPDGMYEDEFGVIWDRLVDSDIGVPHPLITPDTLDDFTWPDPDRSNRFSALENNIKNHPDKFQVMAIDFAIYERAWSLRGMEHLLMDFIDNVDFLESLLDQILKFNLELLDVALKRYPEIDGVYFGDDFGSQHGLIMGGQLWREILKPRLAQQYGFVRNAGKKVFIHSCGKVQELFDDLIEIGVQCFNPFQPEVMDVHSFLNEYHGKLAFHGGISTQKTLPYGSVADVEDEVAALLEKGRRGGYIIAPAHATPGDAKLENMCKMLHMIIEQKNT